MKITKLIEKHPKLTSHINTMLEKRKTKLYQDIVFCLAITLASSFYYFEYYQPKMELMRAFITILMVAVWLGMALLNGFKLKYGFMIFSLAFWFVPQIFILWNQNLVASGGYSKSADISDIICKIIVVNPITTLNGYLNKYFKLSELNLTLIFLLVIIAVFLLGWALRTMIELPNKQKPQNTN